MAKTPSDTGLIVFITLYAILFTASYVSAYFTLGDLNTVIDAATVAAGTGDVSRLENFDAPLVGTREYYLAGVYALMLALTTWRGVVIGRIYVFAPVLAAGLFDIFIAFIPLLPTILMVVAFVLAVRPVCDEG